MANPNRFPEIDPLATGVMVVDELKFDFDLQYELKGHRAQFVQDV